MPGGGGGQGSVAAAANVFLCARCGMISYPRSFFVFVFLRATKNIPSCRQRLGRGGEGGARGEDGEFWRGSVPADRDWLTLDDPVKAMQHCYCPQARDNMFFFCAVDIFFLHFVLFCLEDFRHCYSHCPQARDEILGGFFASLIF